jgi:translation initiation factor IF-1
MAKEELIEMQGTVTEVLPDGRYRVTLENDHTLIAYAGGKLKKNHIRIIAGDAITLEMSSYDFSKGRITFRHLRPAPAARRPARPFSAAAEPSAVQRKPLPETPRAFLRAARPCSAASGARRPPAPSGASTLQWAAAALPPDGTRPMRSLKHLLLPALLCLPLLGPAHAADSTLQHWLDGPQRSEANRTRDAARKPAETLAFFGLQPGLTVVEIWPSVGAWWFEVLAPTCATPGSTSPPSTPAPTTRLPPGPSTKPSRGASPASPRSTARSASPTAPACRTASRPTPPTCC